MSNSDVLSTDLFTRPPAAMLTPEHEVERRCGPFSRPLDVPKGPTRHGGVVCDAIPGGHAPSNSSFLRRLKICEDAGVPLRGPRLEAPDAIFAVQYLLWLP